MYVFLKGDGNMFCYDFFSDIINQIQVFYNYFVLIRLRKTYGLIALGPDSIGCFEEVGKEENSVCSKAYFAFDKYQGSAYNLKLSQNEICR